MVDIELAKKEAQSIVDEFLKQSSLCLTKNGAIKCAKILVNKIIAIPEHRIKEYEIMVGNNHKQFIQALSKHENEYWNEVKNQLDKLK